MPGGPTTVLSGASAMSVLRVRFQLNPQWLYLPVIARQDWVAVLDQQGQIQGFLRGDGF